MNTALHAPRGPAPRPRVAARTLRHRGWIWAATLCGAVWLAGCASTPTTRLHSLMATSPRTAAPASAAANELWLAPINVPAQVDQPQWLLRLEDGSLRLLEQERWAASLSDEWHGALREALGAQGARNAAWQLQVQLTRFDTVVGRGANVALLARWQGPAGRNANCAMEQSEGLQGDGMLALADSQRRALQALAARLNRAYLAARAGQSPDCL